MLGYTVTVFHVCLYKVIYYVVKDPAFKKVLKDDISSPWPQCNPSEIGFQGKNTFKFDVRVSFPNKN